MSIPLTTQQIGKAGELLVQYELLVRGIESSQLTTDAGIDLVAYSSSRRKPMTIQVKTNLKPKPGGGRGKPALDWWLPEDSPATLVAFVDLSETRFWLFKTREVAKLAQQHSGARHHLYMWCDSSVKSRGNRPSRVEDFVSYLAANRIPELFL